MIRFLPIALLWAAPTLAQTPFDPAPTADCVAGGGGAGCVGLAAQACMPADPADLAGAESCLRAEAAWWQAAHDDAYAAALAWMQGRDSATWEIPPPSAAEGLRDMERAWLAWRDARCGLERTRWWEHPAAEQHWLICMMQATAADMDVLTALAAP